MCPLSSLTPLQSLMLLPTSPHLFHQPVQASTHFMAALLNDSLKSPADSSLKQLLHAQTPATSMGHTFLSPALNLQTRLLFLFHCHGTSHLFMSYNQHKSGPQKIPKHFKVWPGSLISLVSLQDGDEKHSSYNIIAGDLATFEAL